MNSETTDGNTNGETEFTIDVKTLQSCLFPAPELSLTNTFFSTIFLKNAQSEIYETTGNNGDEPEPEEWRLKIKESFYSRELFPASKDTAFILQPPRWPTECQVLENRIKHLNYVPSVAERFYRVTGEECQPKPTGDECGMVVYQYIPFGAVNYFTRSSVGGSKYLLTPNIIPTDTNNDYLQFESRFESGNLAKAIRITSSYYELHLRSDLYTNRHMQWFYFRVTNMKKNFLYRFSITNCSKESSLYNEGMKPLMYSVKDSELHSIGWRRCGENITYYSNDNVPLEDPDQLQTYTLTFTITFPHNNDEVYLAHSYPYTYSDLQDYLAEIRAHPVKQQFSNVRLLCRSLAGNDVYFITITSPQTAEESNNKRKRAIVITARVHPGETPSSWIMKGVLDFLTSDSTTAKDLRDKFIFKIIPMLNPDGVVVGNNRCSLAAKDLNRQYRTVLRETYPSIWYTKLMVRRLLEECGVALYCDLHAHSRKHNIFVYGCENRRGSEKRLQEQVFPLMLHKNTADKFSFESCKFRIQKTKEGTGRVVMWMMGIGNSYTMEASFGGSLLGARNGTHFTTQDYEQMGKSFCQTLSDYYDEDPRKERLRMKIIERLFKEGSNADEPTNIALSDYSSDNGDSSSTSYTTDQELKAKRKRKKYATTTYEYFAPVPPPPSPIVICSTKQCQQQRQSKSSASKTCIQKIIMNNQRKPLPIRKATLNLSLSDKECLISDSSEATDDEEAATVKRRIKIYRKKRKKKKSAHHKSKKPTRTIKEHSDNDLTYRKTNLSVFELMPIEKNMQCQNKTKRTIKTLPPKIHKDKKNESIIQQLREVQTKLHTLKNRFWFGTAGSTTILDTPPPCADNQFYFFSSRNKNESNQKKIKKISKKKGKFDSRKEVKHEQNGGDNNKLNRQSTIKWIPKTAFKKSKSLPDQTSALNEQIGRLNLNENGKNLHERTEQLLKTKKSKRKHKFSNKAKAINNAKIFVKKIDKD